MYKIQHNVDPNFYFTFFLEIKSVTSYSMLDNSEQIYKDSFSGTLFKTL
jgi:hypothetical protein